MSKVENIRQRYFNHIEELNEINTTEFCVIRRAMEKYEEQTQDLCDYTGYVYKSAFWQEVFRYCSIALGICKKNSIDVCGVERLHDIYVCSAERLHAVDFNIIYDYVKNIPYDDKEKDRKNQFV